MSGRSRHGRVPQRLSAAPDPCRQHATARNHTDPVQAQAEAAASTVTSTRVAVSSPDSARARCGKPHSEHQEVKRPSDNRARR